MREERRFDGTNSRLRLGIAPCPEVLVDLPRNVTAFDGFGASGFTNLAPAVKRQISPIPEKFDARSTAGPGAQPYSQFPWSVEIGCSSAKPVTCSSLVAAIISPTLNRSIFTSASASTAMHRPMISAWGYSFRSMDRIEGCALPRRRIERFRSGQMLRAFVQYALPARYGA